MTAFLCLHGAWHGGWVWDPVASALRSMGHVVDTPDFPGMGRFAGIPRSPGEPIIGLDAHVAAVTPIGPIILVAHSYAGMVARVIADRYRHHILHLVLVEALWPDADQSALDLLSPTAATALRDSIQDLPDGEFIAPPSARQFHITNDLVREQVEARLTPQPARTFRDTVTLANSEPVGTYVIATDRQPQPYTDTAARLKRRGWRIEPTEGGHELMLTRPDFLTGLLHELSTQEPLCDVN